MLICTPLSDKKQIKELQKQADIEASDHFFLVTNNSQQPALIIIRRTSQHEAMLINRQFVGAEIDLITSLEKELHKLGVNQLKIANDQFVIATNGQDKTDWRAELNHTWHHTIPLSKAMNIEAAFYDHSLFTVTADKGFNQNLHNTMFAGSIYTHATLTGWGWVFMQLKAAKVNGSIVLADADIKYQKPITGQPLAQTQTAENNIDLSPLANSNKASAYVKVNVLNGSTVAARFNGHYVILPASK